MRKPHIVFDFLEEAPIDLGRQLLGVILSAAGAAMYAALVAAGSQLKEEVPQLRFCKEAAPVLGKLVEAGFFIPYISQCQLSISAGGP